MTRRELSKVLHPYTSNEKALLKNDNARSSKNVAIDTSISSSLLYSHPINHNSMVSKDTRAKWTTLSHARTVNHISLAIDVIAKQDNIYDNHRDIYTLNYLTHRLNSHKAISENIEKMKQKKWKVYEKMEVSRLIILLAYNNH